MGYRIVRIEMAVDPTQAEADLLAEVTAYAEFKNATVYVDESNEYPGTWEITLEGNSSFLNAITPQIVNMAARIVCDIDPQDENLKRITSSVSAQLTEQIVDWNGVLAVTSARNGRELRERLDGEASFRQMREEFRIHDDRIGTEIDEYHLIRGADAWRRRHELALMLRVDGLALIAGARRLRRLADDVRRRMPGTHLNAAIRAFDGETPGLIALRDIAEHIDQYSIGRGRNDVNLPEPGDVFAVSIDTADLSISARSHSVQIRRTYRACMALIQCLTNASDHRSLLYLLPPLADYDFEVHTENVFKILPRAKETAEHAQARELIDSAMTNLPSKVKMPRKRCAQCNIWL